MSWLFDAIKTVVDGLYDGVNAVLTGPEPLLMAGIFAVIAWWLRGLVAAVLAFAGFALVDSIALWDEAMSTLSLVLVATVITLVIAMPARHLGGALQDGQRRRPAGARPHADDAVDGLPDPRRSCSSASASPRASSPPSSSRCHRASG